MGSKIFNLNDFQMIGEKPRGREKGAVYQSLENHKHYMIKKTDFNLTINGLVGSNIARLILGESAPKVNLVEGGLIASEYIENFTTFSAALEINPTIMEHPGEYVGAEEVAALIALVAYPDIHPKNMGMRKVNSNVHAAIIDFDLSLEKMEESISYPDYLYKFSPALMVKALDKVTSISNEEINNILDASFDDLKTCYPKESEFLDKRKAEINTALLNRQKVLQNEKNVFELIVAIDNKEVDKFKELSLKIIEGIKQITCHNIPYLSEEAQSKILLSIIGDEYLESLLSPLFSINYTYMMTPLVLTMNKAIQTNNQDKIALILPKLGSEDLRVSFNLDSVLEKITDIDYLSKIMQNSNIDQKVLKLIEERYNALLIEKNSNDVISNVKDDNIWMSEAALKKFIATASSSEINSHFTDVIIECKGGVICDDYAKPFLKLMHDSEAKCLVKEEYTTSLPVLYHCSNSQIKTAIAQLCTDFDFSSYEIDCSGSNSMYMY